MTDLTEEHEHMVEEEEAVHYKPEEPMIFKIDLVWLWNIIKDWKNNLRRKH